MFPTRGASNETWTHNINGDPTRFIEKLSEMGDVYMYMPDFNHVNRDTIDKLVVTHDNLDIDKETDRLYEKIKHHDRYVLIGHSFGALFAMKFYEKYRRKCIMIVMIEPESMRYYFDVIKSEPRYTSFAKFTDDDFSHIVNKIKQDLRSGNDPRQDALQLLDSIAYHLNKQGESIKLEASAKMLVMLDNSDVNPENIERILKGADYTIARYHFLKELMQANMKNIWIYQYINASHFVHWTCPGDIVGFIKSHLEK